MSGSKDERELGKLSSALERAQAELTKREQALEPRRPSVTPPSRTPPLWCAKKSGDVRKQR